MTERELRRLSRTDLLELLLAQRKENEQMRCLLDQTQAQLTDRTIKINNAGSIAEASLQLSGIFEAAQDSCQYYLENIRQLSERQNTVCQQKEAETQEKCDRMAAEAEQNAYRMETETKEKCDRMAAEAEQRVYRMEAEAKEKCDRMVAEAEQRSQQCWDNCAAKIRQLMDSYAGLQQAMEAFSAFRQPAGRQ